jgi:hypothetical protein
VIIPVATAAQLETYDYLFQVKNEFIKFLPDFTDLLAKLQATIDITGRVIGDPAYQTASTIDREIESHLFKEKQEISFR